MLDACAEAAVKSIVYLSSATVYGARHDNPPLLTEDSLARPVVGFQYALDKFLTERIFEKHGGTHQDARVTVLRSCVVMGPGADNFITQAFAKPFLVAVRGYDPPLQFLHEYDLMELITLAARDDRFRGVFNLAGKGDRILQRYGGSVRQEAAESAVVIAIPTGPGRPGRCDFRRTHRLRGWTSYAIPGWWTLAKWSGTRATVFSTRPGSSSVVLRLTAALTTNSLYRVTPLLYSRPMKPNDIAGEQT